MQIRYTDILLPSANLGGVNPLPFFRSEKTDLDIPYDETFTPEEAHLLGYSGGTRVLPYLMQDRYDRNRTKQNVRAVVLENDHLKAIILCDYGGRLYSLYDKDREKEQELLTLEMVKRLYLKWNLTITRQLLSLTKERQLA